jgi:histidine phosphotransferase ChpT
LDDIDFGALLAARLCHDVISPVSAARNGIAMALEDDDPEMRVQAMELTADGLADAVDKLKVYRLAYGVAGPGTTLAEARKATEGLYARGRVRVEWTAGIDPGPDAVRLLTNMVLLGADGVARGGVVSVAPDATRLSVSAEGNRAGFADDILAVLEGTASDQSIVPRQIQAVLAMALARRLGGALEYSVGAGLVSLTARLPSS